MEKIPFLVLGGPLLFFCNLISASVVKESESRVKIGNKPYHNVQKIEAIKITLTYIKGVFEQCMNVDSSTTKKA